MNRKLGLAGCLLAAALVSQTSAQLTPELPGGIQTFSTPSFASNIAQYQADLGDLYFDSDATVPSATINAWSLGTPNLTTGFGSNPWLSVGGEVKVIFLGETAGWLNDFGYTPSNAPGTYKALATNIENNFLSPNGNVTSGWETFAKYSAGTTLDFWLNGSGEGMGGLWSTFGTPNQFAGTDVSAHTRYTFRDVTTTYVEGGSVVTKDLKTLIVGFEDVRQGGAFYDGDYNDMVVAFQFLPEQLPVTPEPSTYGVIASVALIGIVLHRRIKQIRVKATA